MGLAASRLLLVGLLQNYGSKAAPQVPLPPNVKVG
jgi:hypothetical protein